MDDDTVDAQPPARAIWLVRMAWVAAAVSLVGLIGTGVPLIWRYRPEQELSEWWTLPSLHRLFSSASLISLLLVVGLSRAVPHGWWRTFLKGGAVAVAMGVMTYSGHRLDWDQLGLWAVTSDPNSTGVFVQSYEVRFLIVDGEQMTISTYRMWALVHVILVPLASVLALVLWRWLRRRRLRTDGEVVESVPLT